MIKGRKIIPFFLVIMFYGFPCSIIAEFNSTLHGIVIDAQTSKPVGEAVIELIGKEIFATTRPDGKFYFNDLAGGFYRLKVTHIAYKENMIAYDFNEKNQKQLVIYLEPKAIEISTVIISGQSVNSKFEEYYEDINVLKGKELQHNLGLTLASTLKNETGLAIRSMGPAPARPVI